MKVLLANKFFFINGGSETVFFQERDFLLKSGVSVVDFSMADSRNFPSEFSNYFVDSRQYRQDAGKLAQLNTAAAFIHSSEAVTKISALIQKEQPDIVHCHNIYHQLTPSIIGAAHKFGVPVVLTLHDYKPVCPSYLRLRDGKICSECLEGNFFNAFKYRCAEGSTGKSALLWAEAVTQRWLGNYEKLASVIAPSQFMADSVAHRFTPEKITVIPNGIDLDAISASDQDEGYALYLGRLSHEKGIQTLLSAYRQHSLNFPLKVCGTGPLIDELRAEAPQDVEFLGYQTGAALQAIIRKASMIIVPSEWYENCPMAILEAMAYAKPVIGAKIGGIPELIMDGETGQLFEPGNTVELADRIQQLASNKGRRHEMGQNARARVMNGFSLQKHNAALLQVYQDLLSS